MTAPMPPKDAALTVIAVLVGICASCAIDSGILLMLGEQLATGAIVIALACVAAAAGLHYLPTERSTLVLALGIGVGVPVAWFLYELLTWHPKFW